MSLKKKKKKANFFFKCRHMKKLENGRAILNERVPLFLDMDFISNEVVMSSSNSA
jgi:hypothetical protein